MSNKNCPFCKREVFLSDAVCPFCKRILFETIPTQRINTAHTASQGQFPKKHNRLKEHLKNFFAKMIFRKPPILKLNSQNTSRDRIIILGLFFATVLLLYGLFRNKNDVSPKYTQEFQLIGESLAGNVKSVAKDKKTVSNSFGRSVVQYVYENKDLNIRLFNEKWSELHSVYKNLSTDISGGNLPNEIRLNEVMNYYTTDYFFIANELWFRAYDMGDMNTIQKLNEAIKSEIEEGYFNIYLKKNNQLQPTKELINELENIAQNHDLRSTIEKLESEIKDCGSPDNCANYNDLVGKYNTLIPGYNDNQQKLETLFPKFMNLVNAYLLFPGQKTIEQTTIKE